MRNNLTLQTDTHKALPGRLGSLEGKWRWGRGKRGRDRRGAVGCLFLEYLSPMATWGTLAEQNVEIWLKPHQEVWAPHFQQNPRFYETPSLPLI